MPSLPVTDPRFIELLDAWGAAGVWQSRAGAREAFGDAWPAGGPGLRRHVGWTPWGFVQAALARLRVLSTSFPFMDMTEFGKHLEILPSDIEPLLGQVAVYGHHTGDPRHYAVIVSPDAAVGVRGWYDRVAGDPEVTVQLHPLRYRRDYLGAAIIRRG